eukprot:426801_1
MSLLLGMSIAVIFINKYSYDHHGNTQVIKITEGEIHEPPFCNIEYNTHIKSIKLFNCNLELDSVECTYNSSQQLQITHCVLTRFGQQAKPQFLHRHREEYVCFHIKTTQP